MSETLTLDTPTRRPRQAREEEPRNETLIESGGEAISPEQALADSRRQIQEKDRQVADARRLQRESEQRAQAAARELQQTQAQRGQDRVAVVGQALEGAKAQQTAAKLAYRSAREAGDIDAEMAAQEALAAATFQISQASAELDHLKNQQPRPDRQTAAPPSAAAQKWLAEHPRFNTDAQYNADAVAAHNSAIASGCANGSPAYIDYIERQLTDKYGDGHGHEDDGMTPPDGGHRPMPTQQRTASALPPSRNQGSGGGFQRVQTELGDLLVSGDGKRIRFADPNSEANFREGAALDKRYHTDDAGKAAALHDYVKEYLDIAKEIAAGENGGMVRGDGRTYGRETDA